MQIMEKLIILIILGLFLISAVVFFLKNWIKDGVEVAIMRTLRYIIVTGIIAIIAIIAAYFGMN